MSQQRQLGAPLGGTIFRTFLLDYPSLEGL